MLAVVATAAYPLLRGLLGVLDRSAVSPAVSATRAPAAGAPAGEPLAEPVRVIPSEVVIVYRWRDARGTVHFETRPPPEGVKAEVIEMRRPATVVPVQDERAQDERGPGEGQGEPGASPLAGEPFSVYTPGGMDELLRRLDRTVDSLEERRRTMRELEGQL